jgi:hypothetical protein
VLYHFERATPHWTAALVTRDLDPAAAQADGSGALDWFAALAEWEGASPNASERPACFGCDLPDAFVGDSELLAEPRPGAVRDLRAGEAFLQRLEDPCTGVSCHDAGDPTPEMDA